MTAGTTDKYSRLTNPSASTGSLTVTDRLSLSAITETQFAVLVFEREIPHTAQSHWQTSAGSLDGVLEYALATSRSARTDSALLDLDSLFGGGSLALVTLQGETADCRLAATDRAIVADMERWLHDRLPATQATERREIPVHFWSCGVHGANSISRTIAVPTFEDIGGNYPRSVRGRLGELLGPGFRPAEGGQLILWHGAPGTGKTYALRALGWEWRSWCGLHYVVDPEVLFGQRADYMLDVVLGQDVFPSGMARTGRPMSASGVCSCSRTPASCLPPTQRSEPGKGSRAFSTSSTGSSDRVCWSSCWSRPMSRCGVYTRP